MSDRLSPRTSWHAFAATFSLLLTALVLPGRSCAFSQIFRADVHRDASGIALRTVTLSADSGHLTHSSTPTFALPSAATAFGPEQRADGQGQKVVIGLSESPKNFEVALRLRPTSWQAKGGLLLRRVTPRDYYVVQVDALNEKVAFGRVSQDRFAEIASIESDIGADAWHTLNVQAQDDRFTVLLDGKWLFTAYDKALSRPGQVALWTSADGAVEFDNVSIEQVAPP